jgi:hypothetical protein
VFSARSYSEVAEMLRASDTHTDQRDELVWVEAQPIQNLGGDQGNQIEGWVSVRGTEAHTAGRNLWFSSPYRGSRSV